MNLRQSIFLWAIGLFWCSIPCQAAFEIAGASARNSAKAGTVVADGKSLDATFFNPATLAELSQREFLSSGSKLYWGLDEGNITDFLLAIGVPLEFSFASRNANAKMNWEKSEILRDFPYLRQQFIANHEKEITNVQTESIRRNFGVAGITYWSRGVSNLYSEQMVAFAYGYQLPNFLSLGVNLKFLEQCFKPKGETADDPLFKNYGVKANAWAVDTGALLSISPQLSLGLSLTNVFSTSLGLEKEDTLPLNLKLGVKYLNYEIDCDVKEDFRTLRLGTEYWFKEKFGLRGGVAWGNYSYGELAGGFAYRISSTDKGGLVLNYSFSYPWQAAKGTLGTQRLSLNFTF